MITPITTLKWALVLVAALAAACHKNEPSAAPSAPAAAAPIAVTVNPRIAVSYGKVTALGSIRVNGVRYDTSRAQFTVDDQVATEADVHVGDVVRVIGPWAGYPSATGTANSVSVKRALHGPISSIDEAGASLVVLGQTVVVEIDTVFDASVPQRSLAGLHIGNVVEVAGLSGADGKLFASRIAVNPLDARGFRVSGTATNVDHAGLRFTINDLVVDFRDFPWTNLSHETVRNGDRVEVRGSSLGADSALVASAIGPAVALPTDGAAGTRIELEGFITAHDSGQPPATFMLGDVRVRAQGARYDGADTSSWGSWLGAKVQVEGIGQLDGSVAAHLVRVVHAAPIDIRARVGSVSAGTDAFVTLGITVEIGSSTRMTDESAIHAQPFGIRDIVPGDYVHIAGVERPGGSNIVVASLVERLDPQPETQLRGYPQPMTPWIYRQYQILGVIVHTTDATRYPTPTGALLSEWTFIDDVDFESRLEVRGVEIADRTFVANEIRFADWR